MKRIAAILCAIGACAAIAPACDSGYSTLATDSDAGAGGAGDSSIADSGSAMGADASRLDGSGSGGGDASMSNDGSALCTTSGDAGASSATGVFIAPKVASEPRIDGQLDDWCVPFFHFDSKSAGAVVKPTTISADIAVVWTPGAIYLGAHVFDATHPVQDPLDPYKNDAVELYLRPNSVATGTYGATDFHFVVDHLDLARQYSGLGGPTTPPAGFTSATTQTADGYIAEMAFSSALLGQSEFSPGPLGFDTQISDGDGTQQVGVLVFYETANAGCGGCAACSGAAFGPHCDTLLFGTVQLTP
jgi:hypothetical protein